MCVKIVCQIFEISRVVILDFCAQHSQHLMYKIQPFRIKFNLIESKVEHYMSLD